MLLLWALTGAFYPAVDLCAGEKERGTLETLLSSPAERSEIVLGKLLTVMLFSMATAVLNLASMGITGSVDPQPVADCWARRRPWRSCGCWWRWCRSRRCSVRCAWPWPRSPAARKEGQYYLMPLLLVTMPLVILPMAPGVELNLGNSLIPVTGVVLLLRSVLEGNYLAGAALRSPSWSP